MHSLLPAYAELHALSNFSFQRGASHPEELVDRAHQLGYRALALTDSASLAGVVRAHVRAKALGLQLILGAELRLAWPGTAAAGGTLVLLAPNRQAYAQLSTCLSHLRQQAPVHPAPPAPTPDGLPTHTPAADWPPGGTACDQLLALWVPWRQPLGDRVDPAQWAAELQPQAEWLQRHFPQRGWLGVALHQEVGDAHWLATLDRLSQTTGAPLVATGGALMHHARRKPLQDVLTATRLHRPLAQCGIALEPHAQRHLRSRRQLGQIYPPALLAQTLAIAQRCHFSLDELRYEYPEEVVPPGQTPSSHLQAEVSAGLHRRYPQGVPDSVQAQATQELALIAELGFEKYFLTVHDIVRFARSQHILCQGRGSAANSAVCYCLGVTSVDPSRYDLLFERFISRERNEAPDIDIDFEHQRREEVIQYVYEKYGRHRAGMTAAVTTYRIRSATRECAKALGFTNDRIDSLSKIIDGRSGIENLAKRCSDVGIEPESEQGKRFLYLVESILGFPRHLSQHTGGMVMTQGNLCELCPIENASMTGRTIIQWDKDDLDELGILKVDCLALGMLSAIHRSLDLLSEHCGKSLSLATIPAEDSSVYDMICKADTVGVFQIESRAQMSMLPRLRPRCFYDLVIEVAIVRPGPIQGNMVHPYLAARRSGKQPPYPSEAIAQVLRKTMGVPIFQEQAMRLAVVAAGFTPGEADQLRRAMAAWRRPGVIDQFKKKLLEGMQLNGLKEEFAETVFHQIRGFGEYGFPESHAASFALLVYASCWIKHHHPDVFCCAMLNSQPLGFYTPAQLIADAQRHNVEIAPVDLNASQWECTLESQSAGLHRVRLGLCMIRGLHQDDGLMIAAERMGHGPFKDQSQLVRRCRLGQSVLAILADSGAMASLSGNRRAAYWQALGQDRTYKSLPLLEAAGVDVDDPIPEALIPMEPSEEVAADYATTGLSLRGHPVEFHRKRLAELQVRTARDLGSMTHGRLVRVAGLIVLRQRPGTAKGITFVTMEDETGSINIVVRPKVWEAHYLICKQSNAWLVHGTLESREGVIHVVASFIEDLTDSLGPLQVPSRDFR